MKDAEDEAFDDLAKKQGDWGGGFQAKRRMAADKMQEPVSFPCCGYTEAIKWNQFNGVVQCHMCGQVYTAAQPAQEPVAWAVQGCSKMWRGEFAEIDAKAEAKRIGGTCFAYALYTAPPKRERVLFPTMLRKMWSGGEVQAWLDENVNKEKNT